MKKKVYQVTLILGMFSLLISAGLITLILKNNAYLLIDPAQDLYQLEVLDSQKGILQLCASLPSLLFVINTALVVMLYPLRTLRTSPSARYSYLWIGFSMIYQCLSFAEARWGWGIAAVTILFMSATWLIKVAACRAVFRELKTEKRAQKGALCVN